MENYSSFFTPGIYVVNPEKKDEWGIGQIHQSLKKK